MLIVTYVSWWLLIALAGTASGVRELQQRPIQSSCQDDAFDPSFDAFIEDTLREYHVPGLSIATVNDGYGFAVLPNQKATADTQYFGASTTKAFTAAAAALLVHDDDKYPTVKWTTPINQLIPADFVLEDEYATSHTTIEDALSHRTGLPGHDLILGQANDTPSAVVQKMRHLPMTAQPRTQWQYCNMMYGVITDLIQTVTETSLEIFLGQKFWNPLGMLSTTFQIPSEKRERSRLARGYYWSPEVDEQMTATDRGKYVPDVYLDLLSTVGDGAIISTVNDYALWIKALLNAAGDKESWNSSSPITYSLYHDLVTPRAIIPEAEYQKSSNILAPPLYGLGWITAQVASAEIVTHNGGITGFGTQVYMLPAQNYGIVTMGNTLGTSNYAGGVIASRLLIDKLNLTVERIGSDSSVHQSLLRIDGSLQQPSPFKHRRGCSSSARHRPLGRTDRLPLPLPLSSIAGVYTHPAYGAMNLTIRAETPFASGSPSEAVLETLFYRTAVEKEVLTHISGTLFKVQSFEPHGLGDITTGDGIVWEELGDENWEAYAIFEFGIDGKGIERAGIELDPGMIDAARTKGKRHWREGMIWFEKV